MTTVVKDRDASVAGPARFSYVPDLSGADRLVALGFRHWVAGYQTSDIACWEQAWRLFEGELGPQVIAEGFEGIDARFAAPLLVR